MKSPVETAHDEKVNSLIEDYVRQGFTVVREPSTRELPFDLGNYSPDILASRGDTGLIVEVKTTASRVPVDRFQSLAQEISKHPGWRFLLVTLDDVDSLSTDLPTWTQLSAKLQQAESLVSDGAVEPATLYLWSIFEAALRKRAIEQSIPVERLPAPKLLNHMYSLGEISVNDIDLLLEFMSKRNRLAHGANESGSPELLASVLQIVNRLLTEWGSEDSAAG